MIRLSPKEIGPRCAKGDAPPEAICNHLAIGGDCKCRQFKKALTIKSGNIWPEKLAECADAITELADGGSDGE